MDRLFIEIQHDDGNGEIKSEYILTQWHNGRLSMEVNRGKLKILYDNKLWIEAAEVQHHSQ